MVFLIWNKCPKTGKVWTYVTPLMEFTDFTVTGFYCTPVHNKVDLYVTGALDLDAKPIEGYEFKGTLKQCQKYVQQYCNEVEERSNAV